MAKITRLYTFQDGQKAYSSQVNAELDQLVNAHNSQDTSITDLSSTTDGNSGADKVGATPITGGTANTVQGILEELKALDSLKTPIVGAKRQGFDTVAPTPVASVGDMSWNTGRETLDIKLSANVVGQAFQETHIYVRNTSASVIPDGTVVMRTGINADRIAVAPAVCNGTVPASDILGIATEDIAVNGNGRVTVFGEINNLNTSGYAVGTELWASPTVAGGLTTTKPQAPNLKLSVAVVTKSHVNQGIILVRMNAGSELGGTDSNVQITNPADKDLLVYETSTGIWKNKKAGDAGAVDFVSDQTLAGIKTFQLSPVIPAPSYDMQASTKKYVDDKDASRKTYIDNADALKADKATTYTKTNMQTSGQALLHWGNLTNVPNFGDPHWKSPVANRASLPLVGNSIEDTRTVLDDGDGKQAIYNCIATTGTVDQQWAKVADVDWMTEEATRVTQENARVSAENARVTAESGRVSAENTRVSNETSRGSAETTRVSQENARKSAETLRVMAESSRFTAETNRANAETSRASAESSRVTAETNRASAETNRATAETNRASAESSRVSAETGRVNAESARVTAESSRVEAELARELTNTVVGVKFPLASSSSVGTRTHAAIGLTVTPGVGAKGTSDFDKFPVYNWRLCNRVNGVVTAFEGEPGFSTANDTFVQIPKGYYRRYVDATNEYFMVSDKPFQGSKLHKLFNKGGKVQEYVYLATYESSYDGSSKHQSKTGTLPDVSVSRTTCRTRSKARGSYASLQDVHARDWLNLLMLIETANKNDQTALGRGYCDMPYSATHVATVTETAVNRIIIANAFADLFVVGQELGIGTALGTSNVAADRTVTAIDVYDASNKAITFTGTAVNIAIGNIVFTTRQKSGKTDAIGSGTGRATGTDGKTAVRYRGVENPYGNVWEWVDNLNIRNNQGYSDPNGRIELYSDTDFGTNYTAYSAAFPATNNYVKRVLFDENIGVGCLPSDVTGGSDATYYADYYYQNTGDRAALVGGNRNGGSLDGPWHWSVDAAASYTNITLGARLLEIDKNY